MVSTSCSAIRGLIKFVIVVCKLQTKEGVNARVYIEWNGEFES